MGEALLFGSGGVREVREDQNCPGGWGGLSFQFLDKLSTNIWANGERETLTEFYLTDL